MRSSKERMRETAKQLTELENRRKKLKDDYLQTQARFVESSNPEDLKQLRAIETEMDAVKVQLEDLEKLRPTYDARNAEKMYGDYEAEEKKVKEKHGSVEKLVADLDSRAAKLSEQEQRLKELEAQLKVNPSEHTYQTYLRTYDTYTRSVAEYQKLYADYEPVQRAWQDYDAYDKASKSDVGFGEGVKRVVNAGITQTGSLLASTLALPDKLLSKAMPGVATPLADFAAWMKEGADRDAALVQEAVHGKKGWGQAANVGVATVAAIPQMLAALLSSGISTAATGTTLATGAGAPVSMTTSLMNAAKQALKNPSYIASMASTLGSDFDEAKAAGATDIEALATAVIASSVNAGIEIGGGLEAVDDSLPLVQRILKRGREEGWEEVLQGIVSGTVNKGIYDFDKPIASLTDPDAILNPQRMAEEAFTGAAVGMLLTGITSGLAAAANKLTGPRATHTRADHNPVSPAAAPEVQQLTQQAEAVQAANPEATVLDAATTMYFDIAENKGKNTMKKAQLKADVVNRLIEGKKVEDGEINALNLTDQNYREVFTKLTGVQFPDGKLQTEQLRSLARSAHDVAVKAQAVKAPAAPVVPVAPVTETGVAERVAQAQQTAAQAVPETDNAVTFEAFVEHAKQYPEYANAGAEVLEVAYAQFLQDSGMSVEMNGKPMSFAEFVGVLRSAPDGDKLTVGEMGRRFQQLAQRQNMNKEANYGGQNLLHSEGLSGQPDQRSGGQSRSVPETAGRAEGDGGTRRGDQSGSQAGRSGEVRSAGQNQEGTGSYRTVKVNDNPMTEVRPEAYTPEMQDLVDQYAEIGVNAHIVIEGYPMDAEGHYADGITIFNTDGTTDVFLQVVGAHAMPERSGHEKAHVVLGRDPAVKEQAIAALGKAMTEKELLELVNAYLPMYGSAYANSEDLIGDLLEEIICDAYANLDRANAGAPKYHDAVSGVIEAQLQSYSASYGQDVTLTDDAGNLVVESDGNGHSTFSMSTYQDSGRDILTQWMGKAVVNGDLTQQDADDIVNTLDLIYDICEEARGDYAPFDAWSEAKVVVNEQGNPVFSVVKANGDYAMNLDFSLVCKKRRTLDAVLNELVKQGFVDNLALNEKQIVKINDLIRSYGFEVACDLCFVDAKRYRQGKVADDFVKLYNGLVQSMIPKGSGLKPAYFNFGQSTMVDNAGLGIHELTDDQLDFTKIEKVLKEKGEKSVEYKTATLLKTSPADRKLTMRGDFLSTRGFDELNLKNPRVLKLFNSKKGSGGPKSAVSDVQYLNEVLTSKTFTPEKAYAVGGVRIQSFSDYVPRMVFDYVQMIADLAAKKLPAHAYTKEELFVKQFGLTGMKINMSLIPKVVDGGIAPGLDADGNYAWADESFDFNEAKKIQKAKGYSRNCGTIAVGVSDEHIRKLMADPEIRMVIPYHKSGLNPVVAKMNKIEAFVNYTDFQNTRRPNGKNGKKLDKDVAADKKLLNEMPDFNTKMRELGDPRAAAEFYVRWCEDNNLLPKFDQFAYKTIDGMPVEKDGKHVVDENYYKLLEDFTVYDKGKYVEQTGLMMTFPTEDSAFGDMKGLIKRGLSDDALLEAKRDADVPKIVNDIKQMKFSAAGWKPNLDSAEWDIVKSVMNNGRGTDITSIDKMFFESTKGKSVFGIYSTDDDTLLYASRGEDAVREHQFVEFVKEEFENGGLTDTSTKGIRALAERARMQSVGNSGDNVTVGGPDRLGRYAGLDGRQPRFHASGALENVLANILKAEESRRANSVTEQPTQASEESGASSLPETTNPDIRYSVTPQFEKWYKETYGEDLTSSQLKRRLQTAERRAEEAEHDRKAAELKNTIDSQMNLTAWMMHHTKKMREQKRTMNEKLAEARKEKTAAVRAAVAETKEIERAKAEVQHDADRMAERRAAAKRLRTREDAYKQKVTEMKENHKLKRNAAKATLRDKRLLDKKRAEIETEQGPIETLRRDPKERARIKNLQEAAQALRIKGRSLYAIFLSEAAEIERFGRRQTSEVRADELVTILGSCNSTTERIFKKGLFDRGGNRIGDSMSDVFLCWDEAHKKVNEGMQDLLNVFMLNRVTVDRMTIESRAEEALVAFENEHEWLRDMDQKEFARLVAMTETEAEKLGKQEARELAIEYHRRIQRRLRAKNKSVYGDKNGNPVTAESAQAICDKLLAENPWLEEKSQGIYEWWDLFMRTWAVGDTISETEYAMMRSDYPHYVPTYHISYDSVGGAGFVGNGAASVSKAVKKAVGSTKPLSDIHNIEDSFSKLVSKIVRLNRLNEMYMNIIDTAMLDEDGTFADMAYFDWDWQDGAYANANALITGSADIEDLTDTVEETEKAGLEKVGDDYKLTAWRNGRKYTAYLSESLYKSIGDVTGHLTSEAEEIILKVGNTLTGPMKQAITGLNPIFGLRNAVRDFSTAIVNSTSGLAFPKYYAMAWNEIRKGSDRWEQFQALGGTHANYYNNENGFAGTMSQKDNPVKKVFGGLEAFNNAIEAATRFAEYLATVERRGDTYENRLKGIKNAAEVTVDFSRKGKLGKHINAYIPYWNPAVQGIDRLVRSVIDSPDGSAVWKQATMTLGRASMSVVMCEAIQYAVLHALDRDDEWEELNDRTKDTYYCIPLPKSKTFLKIPKNREWGTIIGTPFMRMLEYANGRENPFENYIETALIPNFLPPGVTDIIGISQYIDLATNKDFAGRTIVPYNLQQGTKGYQYDSDTSMFSRLLGQMFVEKISPMQVDYIIQDYLGDFGEMFIMATSEATLTGDQNPIKTAWDILTSPLMADARYSNYAVNKYYDTLEGLDRVVQDRKNQLGTEEAVKTIEYQTQKALNELYGKAITELNREVREMPDGEEKDILKAQIADLAKEAVGFYNDAMSGKIPRPDLAAAYVNQTEVVAKELVRLDSYAEDYNFEPRTSAPKSYVDPRDKKREYVLTEEQQEYFMELYHAKYNEVFERLIASSKYRKAKEIRKLEMLEDAKQDAQDAAKAELLDWFRKNGVRSTPKK
jgi:hypothetical protein